MVSETHRKDGRFLSPESVIMHVRDVLSCHIVRNEQGRIGKVHILAGMERNPGAISRDVETALLGYGFEIDRSRISIAQVRHEGEHIPTPKQIELTGMRYNYSGATVEVEVQLRFGDETSQGRTCGPTAEDARLLLAAQAAVNALGAFLPGNRILSVDEVFSINLKAKNVIVITLSVSSPESREEYISGSSVVKGDEMEAVARATLDAVNGKLMWMTSYEVDEEWG